MKYPYDAVSYVRKKTFSIQPRFARQTEDKPLQIFDTTFSRFVFTVIANSKAAYGNVPVDMLAEIKANTDFSHTKHMENKYAKRNVTENNSPAYTVRFFSGNLKGKTPVDVLVENGEKGKQMLNDQYKWLKDNLAKYPANQKIMDAIIDAGKLDFKNLSDTQASSIAPIELFNISCRPLIRKKREDGKCFCYEVKAEWDVSKNYPVSVEITNYYAPVTKKEDGTLNVSLSKKDKSSEIKNEFNMTAAEWLNAVRKMEALENGFIEMHLKEAFSLADKAETANRTAAQKAS